MGKSVKVTFECDGQEGKCKDAPVTKILPESLFLCDECLPLLINGCKEHAKHTVLSMELASSGESVRDIEVPEGAERNSFEGRAGRFSGGGDNFFCDICRQEGKAVFGPYRHRRQHLRQRHHLKGSGTGSLGRVEPREAAPPEDDLFTQTGIPAALPVDPEISPPQPEEGSPAPGDEF